MVSLPQSRAAGAEAESQTPAPGPSCTSTRPVVMPSGISSTLNVIANLSATNASCQIAMKEPSVK